MPWHFGDREVSEFLETPSGFVKVAYKDGVTEEMTRQEWEDGRSDKPLDSPQARQEWFVKRTKDIRKEAAKVLFSRNPRYWDVPKIIIWIQEGIKDAYETAVSWAFGVKSFENDATMDAVIAKSVEAGLDSSKGLDAFELAVLELVRKHDIKVWQVRYDSLFANLMGKLKEAMDKAVEHAIGVDNAMLRTNDIEKILKRYEEKMGGGDTGKSTKDEPAEAGDKG